MAPRATAASVGCKPAAPLIAAITQSAGLLRCLNNGVGTRRGGDPGPGQCILEFRIKLRIGNRRDARGKVACKFRQRAGVLRRGDSLDPIAIRLTLEKINRAGADRAGRA